MDQQRDQVGDYGYDEAHDVPSADAHGSPAHRASPPVHVDTESSDHEQDYSYDLAHEVPR